MRSVQGPHPAISSSAHARSEQKRGQRRRRGRVLVRASNLSPRADGASPHIGRFTVDPPEWAR
jgi:hypothetical protein